MGERENVELQKATAVAKIIGSFVDITVPVSKN
jgi:hypothetical protein